MACNHTSKNEYTNSDGNRVVEELYTTSNLKSRTIFLSPDSSDYIFISYYENGDMQDSAHYINNLVEGLRKYYDQQGDLLHFENYKSGIFNGTHKALYSNGFSSFEGYHMNGYKVGEWTFHYPDGRPITYEFYDSTGRIKYFRKFDEKGNTTESNGSAIIGISVLQNEINNDTAIFEVISAYPPSYSIGLEIMDKNENSLFNQTITTNKTLCNLVFTEKGETDLEISLNMFDSEFGKAEHHKKDFKFIKL